MELIKPIWTSLHPLQGMKFPDGAHIAMDHSVNHRIQSLALPIFKKIAIGFSINCMLISFNAFSIPLVLFTLSLGSVLLISLIDQKCLKILIGEEGKRLPQLNTLANLSLVSALGHAGPFMYLHEWGHAIAARLLLNHASPRIRVVPFVGASTRFSVKGGLSAMGLALGETRSSILITLAGISMSTFSALIALALAHFSEEKHPTCSHLLRCLGVSQLLQEITYGLSSFVADPMDLAHDFVRLEVVGGINPLLPIGTMILLPLIEHLALKGVCKA